MSSSSGPGMQPPAVLRPGRAQSPGYVRGIRLGDLDRERLYVIGYSGRRWEVVGQADALGIGDRGQVGVDPGNRPPAAAHRGNDGGRHSAPAIDTHGSCVASRGPIRSCRGAITWGAPCREPVRDGS